jgi:hypothetical protein
MFALADTQKAGNMKKNVKSPLLWILDFEWILLARSLVSPVLRSHDGSADYIVCYGVAQGRAYVFQCPMTVPATLT